MEILLEPFDDIVPRAAAPPPRVEAEANRRVKKKEKKNLSLLSFGEEAQEEEGAQQVGDETFWGEGLKNEAEGEPSSGLRSRWAVVHDGWGGVRAAGIGGGGGVTGAQGQRQARDLGGVGGGGLAGTSGACWWIHE